jgi:hypothetical protein
VRFNEVTEVPRGVRRVNDCASAAKQALPTIVAMMPTSASEVESPRTGTSGCGKKFSPAMSTTNNTTPAATGIVAARSVQSCPAKPPAPMKIDTAAQPDTTCANQSGLALGSEGSRLASVANASAAVMSEIRTSAAKIVRQACGAATNAPATGPSAAARRAAQPVTAEARHQRRQHDDEEIAGRQPVQNVGYNEHGENRRQCAYQRRYRADTEQHVEVPPGVDETHDVRGRQRAERERGVVEERPTASGTTPRSLPITGLSRPIALVLISPGNSASTTSATFAA